jgi:hypothetical protein
MKSTRMLVVCAILALTPAAWAQKWEFGGGVGGGFYTSQDVTSPGGSVAAKIQNSLAGSAWLDNNGQGHWGGELRYDYQTGDLELAQGSSTAAFGARSQAVHYDFLWHFTDAEANVRPFVSAGAGVKIYQGTGTEMAFQPLSEFALLTKDQDLTALVSVGAGVKLKIAPHVQLRLDIHDYLTPFPNKVIAPAQNSKVSGWIQDFVPMVGLAAAF